MHNGVSYNPMNGRLTTAGIGVRKEQTEDCCSYEDAKPQNDSSNHWSGTENNRNNARNVNFNNGNANNNNKNNGNVVRPVAAYQDYDVPKAFVDSVWEAYRDCLKGKMRSKQALEYMEIADKDIPVLAQELWSGTYHPGTSTCFLGPLSETQRGIRGKLQRPHRSSLDMSAFESIVRGTLRETGQCLVQLSQGVWYGESSEVCRGRNEARELQLSQARMGVQRRSCWILHVDRQRLVVVSIGTLHTQTTQALRVVWMEESGHGDTCTAQYVRNAGNVLGYSRKDGQGRGHAPSRIGLHTEHASIGVARLGTEQESVHQSDRRAYRQFDYTIICQLLDVVFRCVCAMAVSEEELLLCAVCGRLRDNLRRPALPCGGHTEIGSLLGNETSTEVTQEQEVLAASFARREIRWHLYQARQTVSCKHHRCPHDGTVLWIQASYGKEGAGRHGQRTHDADLELVQWLHKEKTDLRHKKEMLGTHRQRLLETLLSERQFH